MTKKLSKSLMMLCVAIVASLSLSSCGSDEPPYDGMSYLVGRWALVEVNDVPVPVQAAYDYEFYDDGTGARVHFTPAGAVSYEVPLTWYTDATPQGAEYLYVRTYDNYYYTYLVRLEYEYDYESRLQKWFMYLTDLDTGELLTFEEY